MNQTIQNEWSISQTTPAPLLTPSDLYSHLRLFPEGSPESHPDDDLITAYIGAATQAVENYTQRSLVQRTVTLKRADLSERLYLPVYPVLSVDSITYLDRNGDEQTLTDFTFIGDTIPAWVKIEDPPDVLDKGRPVTFTVTAGYPSEESPPAGDLVPETFKIAAKLMVGNLYENRESVSDKTPHAMPHSFEYLLHPLRVLGV